MKINTMLNVSEGILSETLSYNTLTCFAQNNSFIGPQTGPNNIDEINMHLTKST